MKTNEDKFVEDAKLLLHDIEITTDIEKALHLCYKLGYHEGRYDMQNSMQPVRSNT